MEAKKKQKNYPDDETVSLAKQARDTTSSDGTTEIPAWLE